MHANAVNDAKTLWQAVRYGIVSDSQPVDPISPMPSALGGRSISAAAANAICLIEMRDLQLSQEADQSEGKCYHGGHGQVQIGDFQILGNPQWSFSCRCRCR